MMQPQAIVMIRYGIVSQKARWSVESLVLSNKIVLLALAEAHKTTKNCFNHSQETDCRSLIVCRSVVQDIGMGMNRNSLMACLIQYFIIP
jgi:hypothetical protein